MSDQWYYQAFGQEFGPLAEEEVARMLLSGELTADDTVRQGADGQWTKAGKVPGLMNLVTAVAVETAEVATDIDSFLLVDEQEIVTSQSNEFAVMSDFDLSSDDEDYELDEEPEEVEDEEPAVWYFQTFGTELGPVALSELGKLVQRGELSASDAIREGTEGEWITAGEIPALFPNGVKTAPVPARREPTAAPISNQRASNQPAAPPEWDTRRAHPSSTPASVTPAARAAAQAPAPVAWTAPAADVDTNWYCYLDEQEFGPYGITELQGWAAAGRVTADVYVKYGAQGEWVLASQVPNLLPSTEPIPANPSQVVFVPVAPAAPSPISLADSERSELVQQLLALLKKEGLQTSLLGSINTSAPTTGAGWYCNISGSIMGPVSIEALVQMVLQKRIFPDDLIRLGDSGEWFPAKSVPDLFPDSSTAKGKKNSLDDELNVMERIDKMYREAQEAKAKQDAANAANPSAKSGKSEPSRARLADNMLHEMSAKLARGKSEAELAAERAARYEEFVGSLKLDRKSITILGVLAFLGLGYLLMPIILEDFFAGQSFDRLMALKQEMTKAAEKGADGGWDKKSKEWLASIASISKGVQRGKPKSAKREVSSMAGNLKEMVRTGGRKVSSTGDDDYSKAQKRFEEAAKKAKKALGRK